MFHLDVKLPEHIYWRPTETLSFYIAYQKKKYTRRPAKIFGWPLFSEFQPARNKIYHRTKEISYLMSAFEFHLQNP